MNINQVSCRRFNTSYVLCLGSEERIRNGAKKIMKSRQGSTQGRLDTFFTITGSISSKRKVCVVLSVMSFSSAPMFVGCVFLLRLQQDEEYLQLFPFQEPEAKGSAKKKQKTGATPGKFKKGK